MNVTAFVRQTATAKKKATIYIRVRDNDTKTDIKAATELSINPAYWDADRLSTTSPKAKHQRISVSWRR